MYPHNLWLKDWFQTTIALLSSIPVITTNVQESVSITVICLTCVEFSQSTAPPQLEVTQVAEQPDTESFVEQITYLTSWPQSNTNVCNLVDSWPHVPSYTHTNQHECMYCANAQHMYCML